MMDDKLPTLNEIRELKRECSSQDRVFENVRLVENLFFKTLDSEAIFHG